MGFKKISLILIISGFDGVYKKFLQNLDDFVELFLELLQNLMYFREISEN